MAIASRGRPALFSDPPVITATGSGLFSPKRELASTLKIIDKPILLPSCRAQPLRYYPPSRIATSPSPFETKVMMEYLERFPHPPLLPRSPVARA